MAWQLVNSRLSCGLSVLPDTGGVSLSPAFSWEQSSKELDVSASVHLLFLSMYQWTIPRLAKYLIIKNRFCVKSSNEPMPGAETTNTESAMWTLAAAKINIMHAGESHRPPKSDNSCRLNLDTKTHILEQLSSEKAEQKAKYTNATASNKRKRHPSHS